MGETGESIRVLHVDDDPEFAETVETFPTPQERSISSLSFRLTRIWIYEIEKMLYPFIGVAAAGKQN